MERITENKLNKEWKEVYDNYLNFSNSAYSLNLFDETIYDFFEENTMSYIYEEVSCENFASESYKIDGFNPKKETIREWVAGYWSSMEVIFDMFNTSNIKKKVVIIEVFELSLQIHFTTNLNFMEYEDFVLKMKRGY